MIVNIKRQSRVNNLHVAVYYSGSSKNYE